MDNVVSFDWTPILTAVITLIGAAFSAGFAYLWRAYAYPWLAAKGLDEAARVVVYAVEAAIGRGFGADKWELALQKMADRGYYVDSDMVIDALKAAWQKLNLEQIMAGEKEPEKTIT